MGFFSSDKEVIDKSIVGVDELERMVYETYQEKLNLESELEKAKARIKHLEDQEIKLKAANEFSRQSESERKRLEEKVESLTRKNERLESDLKQEKASVTTRDIKIERLQRSRAAGLSTYKHEVIEDIKAAISVESGNWSKARVIDFLDAFENQSTGSDGDINEH